MGGKGKQKDILIHYNLTLQIRLNYCTARKMWPTLSHYKIHTVNEKCTAKEQNLKFQQRQIKQLI